MAPIIGLTTYGFNEKHTVCAFYEQHYAIPKVYVDAVTRAGGVPLLIPSNDTDWKRLWPVLDGIIVTGGTDVSPVHYQGDHRNAHIEADDLDRDEAEIALVRHAAAQRDKPVLCVCRGMQVMNVALGGTLTVHIPEIRDVDIHRGEDGLWTMHDCLVAAGARLAELMQAKLVHTFSGHHQAVDRVADGLQVVATAPDGIIEALTVRDHPWFIGVQWHPEKSADQDPTQQRLFDELVRASNKPPGRENRHGRAANR